MWGRWLAGLLRIGQGVFLTVSLSQLIQRGIMMLARVRELAVAVVSDTIRGSGERKYTPTRKATSAALYTIRRVILMIDPGR